MDWNKLPYDVIANLIVSAICAAIGWAALKLMFLAKCGVNIQRPIRLVMIVMLVGLIGVYHFWTNHKLLLYSLPLYLLIAFLVLKVDSYWRVGIVGVDTKVESGIDYTKSLRLCNTRFEFLGIGAHKLTEKKEEFREAVRRCGRLGAPVKLLLSHPDNPVLVAAANRQNKNPKEYRNRVLRSLNYLAELRREHSLILEIRLYKQSDESNFPFWRLFFANGVICLASFNVFGEEGEGRHQPQLHLSAAPTTIEKRYFMYPFREYFDSLWNSSEKWNFDTSSFS